MPGHMCTYILKHIHTHMHTLYTNTKGYNILTESKIYLALLNKVL